MKVTYMLLLPFALACAMPIIHAADNDGKVEIKEKDKNGKHEFKMKVKRSGDHFVGVYDNHEYILRGDAAARITTDGDYTVYGDIAPDQTYFETTELQPVVVEERRVERHDHDRVEHRDGVGVDIHPGVDVHIGR